GDDIVRGLGVDELADDGCQGAVVPGGEQDAGDEAAEREQLQQQAAQKGHDGGPGQNGDQEPVEVVELHKEERPLIRRKASRYFSRVFSTTSGGSAGAGSCLFQW